MSEATPSSSESVIPRLMIAGSRKPISYLNTAKRLLGEHGRLELCALGIALAPLVTVAEILKAEKLAVEERVETAFETVSNGPRQRQKAKLTIILKKSSEYEEVTAGEQPGRGKLKAGGSAQAGFAQAEPNVGIPDGPLMEELGGKLLYGSQVDVTEEKVLQEDKTYAAYRI